MDKDTMMLVTGASGYVGSFMVEHLLELGVPVRAMVRANGRTEHLEARGVEIVVADLKDAGSLARAVEGVAGIFHIGAIFRQAGLPESEFFEINAEGTRRLLDAAVAAGVGRFIHCSTGGVLGNIENPPGTEESPYNPGDMYQRSKLAGEQIAMEYFRKGVIRGVVIRPAMIYGPGDTRNLKMFKMIARRRFFYIGDGMTSAHFVDVRDLVRAFALAMEKSDLNAEVYIIPGEKPAPLKEMVKLIASQLGVPPPRLHLPVKPMQWAGSLCEAICTPLGLTPPIFRRRVDFFTKTRHFDGRKAARDLGYRPAKRFEDELREITGWYQQHSWL